MFTRLIRYNFKFGYRISRVSPYSFQHRNRILPTKAIRNYAQITSKTSPKIIFSDARSFLSNHHLVSVQMEDGTWPSVEHYYQAQKFTDFASRNHIRTQLSAEQAYKYGRTATLRTDWAFIRKSVMEKALRAKFTQHRSLQQQLIDTGDSPLVFRSKDQFWGADDDGSGDNYLGFLLSQIRSELVSKHHLSITINYAQIGPFWYPQTQLAFYNAKPGSSYYLQVSGLYSPYEVRHKTPVFKNSEGKTILFSLQYTTPPLQFCAGIKNLITLYENETPIHTQIFDCPPIMDAIQQHASTHTPRITSYPVSEYYCFEPNALVTYFDGRKVACKDVKEGDVLMSTKGTPTTVQSIQITETNEVKNMVLLNDEFYITPGHPIFTKGDWYRPDELFPVSQVFMERVYNFHCEPEHGIMVGSNPVECSSLGCLCPRLAEKDPISDAIYGSGYGTWRAARYRWVLSLKERIPDELIEPETEKYWKSRMEAFQKTVLLPPVTTNT